MDPRKVLPVQNFTNDTPPSIPLMSWQWTKSLGVITGWCRFFGFFGMSGMAQTSGVLQVLGVPELWAGTPTWIVRGGCCSMPVLGLSGLDQQLLDCLVTRIPLLLLLLTSLMRTASASPLMITPHTVCKAMAAFQESLDENWDFFLFRVLGVCDVVAETVAGLILCP